MSKSVRRRGSPKRSAHRRSSRSKRRGSRRRYRAAVDPPCKEWRCTSRRGSLLGCEKNGVTKWFRVLNTPRSDTTATKEDEGDGRMELRLEQLEALIHVAIKNESKNRQNDSFSTPAQQHSPAQSPNVDTILADMDALSKLLVDNDPVVIQHVVENLVMSSPSYREYDERVSNERAKIMAGYREIAREEMRKLNLG